MRQDLHDPNIFNALLKSGKLSHTRSILSGDVSITENGAIVSFLEASGADRNAILPAADEGLFFFASNVGATNNILIKDQLNNTVTTLTPGDTTVLLASESEWVALRGWAALAVFTNTTNGLVPAPNSVTPGSLFLRDDGQWGQVQVVGIVDAFKYMSDGTNIAVGSGPDTFKFRSSSGKITATVTNNEAVHGDNVNLTVNDNTIDHNALLNYSANRHIDHTAVSISAGQGLTGGGDISANRSLALDINGLGVIAPVLADSIAFYDASGTTQGKTTLTVLNGILDHNALLNYSANQHVDHSTVSVIAGMGLSGGGAITSSVTLNMDFTEFPTDDPPVLADYFAFYDVSESDHGRATITQLNGILDHDSLLGFVANEHIDHSTVSISAGTGLTGGGTIAASRTLSLDTIATQRIFANISGGAAAPSANTLTGILDNIVGSTRGMILVRGSASWQALALGANNTYLKSDGTDLTYASIAAGGDVTGPASSTNNGFAKFNGTTGKIIKDSAAVVAIADGGTGQTTASAALSALGGEPGYASGTAMLFQQTSAPTGYTKGVSHNDKALRVVTGAAGSGGSSAFSTVFGKTATDGTTLTNSHLPATISSSAGTAAVQSGGSFVALLSSTAGTLNGTLYNGGSGGNAHDHAMDIRVQYVDVIIATKN